MSAIKVSIDTVKHTIKPDKQETMRINNRIASGATELNSTTLKSFAENIGQHGMSFAPATFKKGLRKAETFEQMQLLTLDFDNGVTLEEISDRAKKYDFPILFAYETLNSTNQNKFRVAFLNNAPINDCKLAEISNHALMEIFPEADKNCKDVSRMYFGGKKLLYFDDDLPTVDTELLLRNMSYYMKNRRGVNHYKTHIRKFANKHGIKLNSKGLLDIVPIDEPLGLDEPTQTLGDARTERDGETFESKNGNNSPKPFIIYKSTFNTNNGNGEKFPKSSKKDNLRLYYQINMDDGCTSNSVRKQAARNRNHKDYRAYDLENISSKCRLYKEFISGERRLHHVELFGVATNMIQVETGTSVFKNILSSYPEYYDDTKQEKWDFHLKYLSENDYCPQRCENFCPYADTCQHTSNILTTAIPKRRTMERVSGHEESYCTVDEAYEDLKQKLIQAIETEEDIWHIIKAQTALGKTQAYLTLAKELGKRFLIVVPTNILKHDVQSRADGMGISATVSPSLDEIQCELPSYVWGHIGSLRDAGLHSKVYPYIARLAYSHPDKMVREPLCEYLKRLDEFKRYDGHAIITHRRFLNMDESELKKYDVIIIDEDIILSCIATDQLTIPIPTLRRVLNLAQKNLSNLRVSNPERRSYKALVKKIKGIFRKVSKQRLFEMPPFEWDVGTKERNLKEKNPTEKNPADLREIYDDIMDNLNKASWEDEEVDGISALTDIPSFSLAESFIYRKSAEEKDLEYNSISFLRPFKFKDIKCIMVSATANKVICEHVFGADRVQFHECKKARLTGTLYQYYDRSMSRRYIAENHDVFDKIEKWSGFEHLITFKKYASLTNSELWFGNLAGIDYLKGQNMNVVGTPHYPEFVYKLLPHALGLNFDHDAKMKYMTIIRNGHQFYFTTFEDEILREFHLWMIESELEQAVGRARLLRCPSTVNLFSNYPIEQAIMRESEY